MFNHREKIIISALRRQRHTDPQEFEASLVYRASSKTVKATQRNAALKKHKLNKGRKKGREEGRERGRKKEKEKRREKGKSGHSGIEASPENIALHAFPH